MTTQNEVKAYIIALEDAETAYRQYSLPIERVRLVGNRGLINHPLDQDKLASFYNESTYHREAVSVKARDVIGHGWFLEQEFGEDENPTSADANEALLDNFFRDGAVEGFTQFEIKGMTPEGVSPLAPVNTLGPGEPIPLYSNLNDVMEKILIDYDTVGNGYLVVIRDDKANGVPTWYSHIQSSRMKIHRDRLRFRWSVGNQTHWFKRWGVSADVDIKTGDYFEFGALPMERRASEVIHFANYTPTDSYYGLPEITPAVGAMVMESFVVEVARPAPRV